MSANPISDSSNKLSPDHLRMLKEGSGLSDEIIAERGYRTISDPKDLGQLGFKPTQQRTPGLLLPGHGPDGTNGFSSFRPDSPRQARNGQNKLTSKIIKYEFPAGMPMRLDCPPRCVALLQDPKIPLWLTEGQKKADALATHGLCAVALLGVWNFKGKNQQGGVIFSADWDYIALNGRQVNIVYDSDLMFKPEVRQALERITEHLKRKRAAVSAVYLPGGRDTKIGVDDFLLSNDVSKLEALLDAPRPRLKAALPVVELLESAPAEIRRPLALIHGRGWVSRHLTGSPATGNYLLSSAGRLSRGALGDLWLD